VVEPDRPQMTIRGMRMSCWIPNATYTHSEYVILIPFPLQWWLQERASMLRYTHICCLLTTHEAKHKKLDTSQIRFG